MLIEKTVFKKMNTINRNLIRLANKNNIDVALIRTLADDMAYIVGKINMTYESFSAIISKEIKEKD
jgi:hypothetical protein|tara:strand:- start:481 stop:678 length:198 start_codon:yes stop_codon:yes gene_type:complete